MVTKDVDRESDSPRSVTPMSEIRRHKALLFDDFTRTYPDWEWSERRRLRLMFDEEGHCWVPTFNPEFGVYFAYDEPGYTPEAEDRIREIGDKAMEDIRAGKVTYLDELDDEDDE